MAKPSKPGKMNSWERKIKRKENNVFDTLVQLDSKGTS